MLHLLGDLLAQKNGFVVFLVIYQCLITLTSVNLSLEGRWVVIAFVIVGVHSVSHWGANVKVPYGLTFPDVATAILSWHWLCIKAGIYYLCVHTDTLGTNFVK